MTPNPGQPDDDEDVEQIKANGRNNDQIRGGDQTIHACVAVVYAVCVVIGAIVGLGGVPRPLERSKPR